MTPIRSANLGMPSPLAQTPGALTAQGIEARKAFFSAALTAAQAPARPAAPVEPMRSEPAARATTTETVTSSDRADPLGRPGRLLDIRV